MLAHVFQRGDAEVVEDELLNRAWMLETEDQRGSARCPSDDWSEFNADLSLSVRLFADSAVR